ncbi:DUF4367 domain-containing protein [Niallia alba]|uniref:DUF4367 domain-containing protein n=1 Tax=Niallia alba TaxID=2729105 RepID=UPI0039A09DB7
MGMLYKEQLDIELQNLEADIYWDKERKKALRLKLKDQVKGHKKRRKPLQPLPFVAIMAAAAILFLFTRIESPLFQKGEEQNAVADREVDHGESVIITVEDQKKVESKTTVFLSDEAMLPYTLNPKILSSIKRAGEPKISARKVKDSIIVNAEYPLKDGNYLSIHTEKKQNNVQGNNINSVIKKEQSLTVNNKQAVLVKEETEPKLIIRTNRYQYTISGMKEENDLIRVAEMIHFK